MSTSSANPYASLKTPFSECELCLMRRDQAKHLAAAGLPSPGGADNHAPFTYVPSLSRASSSSSTASSTSSHGAWSPSLDGPCQCGKADHRAELR